MTLAERVRTLPCLWMAHPGYPLTADAAIALRAEIVAAVATLEEAAWAYVLSKDADDSPHYRALVKALEVARG